MLNIPEIWELLGRFKDLCQSRGWQTSEHEDWVKIGEEYHNFVWIRTVHPLTFEKISLNHKCAVRKGHSYQVVDVAYMAWLFPQTSPDNLMQMVKENLELSKRIAIYDLSKVYTGKPICSKSNETESMVFQEFERFLERWGLEVKTLHGLSARACATAKCAYANTNSEKEGRDNRKIYVNLVKNSLDYPSYDRWVFENYIKERLKALGVIN